MAGRSAGSMRVEFDRFPHMAAMVDPKFFAIVAEYSERVSGRAKDLCPVDTGNLRASIHADYQGARGMVGTNVEYAPYVEFGTYRMAARSYLGQAIADVRPAWNRAITAYVQSIH